MKTVIAINFFALLIGLYPVTKAVAAVEFTNNISIKNRIQTAKTIGSDCVLILYDQSKDNSYKLGKTYSIFLQNLLAHFPQYQQIISPIEAYQAGEIEHCKATFYIGSYFDNEIPSSFYKDFLETDKSVVWMGYSIWNLGVKLLENLFGFKYSHLTKLNNENLIEGAPSFFKNVYYKGEVFDKFGEWVERDGAKQFAAPFEQVVLTQSNDRGQTLAWAEQNYTKERIPYAIRANNHFYIADVPFSFAHESDRYLIFCDLLFDILNEKPKRKKPLAMLRMEDVHPKSSLPNLYAIDKVFKELNIPMLFSLVPIFFDPLYTTDRPNNAEFVPITREPAFMGWLQQVRANGAQAIWHGVTHQYQRQRNPHSGYTSDDFEFWDAVKNKPLELDSVNFVLNRLDDGYYYLKKAGLNPLAWISPHYQASPLDYTIFSNVFSWNIGRVIYFPDFQPKLPKWDKNKRAKLLYSNNHVDRRELQNQFFAELDQEPGAWFGQLFPFEIFGDIYGQKLIPENLGNVQPFTSDHVVYPRSIDEILDDAKRNLVIRDSWASAFFHPYLLNELNRDGVGQYPRDTRPLVRLLLGLKNLGYEFVDLADFIENSSEVENVERIYLK